MDIGIHTEAAVWLEVHPLVELCFSARRQSNSAEVYPWVNHHHLMPIRNPLEEQLQLPEGRMHCPKLNPKVVLRYSKM